MQTDAAVDAVDVADTAAPDAARDCSAEVAAIAKLTTGRQCTAVVRLDYTTLAPLGWQMSCGSPRMMNELDARDALGPWIAPRTSLAQYKLVSTPPDEPWVFFYPPSDFGGIGAVSTDTGNVVFAGGIVWSGLGEIAFPSAWRPATELAASCPFLPPGPPVSGFLGSPEMKDNRIAAARAVFTTALPAGLSRGRGVASTYVIGYPRGVGSFSPEFGEWIVVLESPLLY